MVHFLGRMILIHIMQSNPGMDMNIRGTDVDDTDSHHATGGASSDC
jgi:hypothetical protein